MDNMREKDFDALFQDGAEHTQFDYNPAAWELMEEKLDNQEKDRKKRWIIFFFALLGLSLFIGYAVSNTDNNRYAENQEQSDITTTNVQKSNNQDKENAISTIRNATNTIVDEPKNESESIYQNANQKVASRYTSKLKDKVTKRSSNQKISQSSEKDKSLTSETHSISAEHEKSEVGYNEAAQQAKIQILINPLHTSYLPLLLDNRIIENPEIEIIKNVEQEKVPLLAYTIYGNPEWSSIGLSGKRSLGYSFGAKIGLNLSNHLEARLGIGLSRKMYSSVGNSYTMDNGWVGDVEPMFVDAKCDIMEVPLNIRYYHNGSTENGIFYDVGISNYMIHSEWYGFTYDNALVLPNSIAEVQENNENKHLVGVGSVSIGYQHALGNRFYMQLSPYLQFPLTGIGAGKANLYSSGIQFAIKFQ